MATSNLIPEIVFEDASLLVINKPSGLVVNRAQSVKVPTLQDWLEKKMSFLKKAANSDFAKRSGIVHRLDKETSGLLLVAKTLSGFAHLQSQFKQREVEKKYLALVHGFVKPEKGVIKMSIARNPLNRRKFGIFLRGKKAETSYRTVKNLVKNHRSPQAQQFSLLALFPKTGRTHQLRVHLKHLNHPLVADPLYGGRKTYRSDKNWCPRLFLHASFISFFHPESGKRVSFSSPLPVALKNSLEKLSLI